MAAERPPREAVEACLAAYGLELERVGAAQVGSSFSGDADADELLRENAFAFLVGVLFTQGIPAERAWLAPYELRKRLGHLDPGRMSAAPERVREALQKRPMLHRFKETLPRWVVAAARRVQVEYDGDAVQIWSSGSHVLDVTDRLIRFEGIGRKKAVMAAGILSRHMGVQLRGLECGQVAYDVQVRRVFLRSGLADEDTPEAIEAAATRACPDSPARLDLAAWLIGRETCRPRVPRCGECVLAAVCARRTWIRVPGVGERGRA